MPADPNPVYPSHLTVTIGVNESVNIGGSSVRSVGRDVTSSVVGHQQETVGRNFMLTAGDSLVLRCGAASITMKKDGSIVIKGSDITLDASGKINAKSSSDLVIKGSKIGSN